MEAAQGGTLFLDEIGEMSLSNQVKLLDFLQNKQVTRLGGGGRRNLDVRVISATNRDLKACVAAGTFREDLYYRIWVVLEIPPLRDRPDDIAAFASRYLGRNFPDRSLSPEAVAYLQSLEWPGNLRELHNFLEKVCILAEGPVLTQEVLESYYQAAPKLEPPPAAPESARPGGMPTLREAVAQFEREYIRQAIAQTATLGDAARRLGIDLDTLNRKKRQYKIYKRWKR